MYKDFKDMMKKLKLQITTTRTGYEVEDVDKMCEYVYYIMRDEIMLKDKHIKELEREIASRKDVRL